MFGESKPTNTVLICVDKVKAGGTNPSHSVTLRLFGPVKPASKNTQLAKNHQHLMKSYKRLYTSLIIIKIKYILLFFEATTWGSKMSLALQASFNFLAEEHGGASTVRLYLMSTLSWISLVQRWTEWNPHCPKTKKIRLTSKQKPWCPEQLWSEPVAVGRADPPGSHSKPVLTLVQEGKSTAD